MVYENLVHRCSYPIAGNNYEILLFSRPDGSHVAKTAFSEEDVIITDGLALHEVLSKHLQLLPLAVSSRNIIQEYRKGMVTP